MSGIIAFLQLIRWKNLLIVVLTQWLLWAILIQPLHTQLGLKIYLDAFHCFLLILSTVLIAASGYIINDYFDTKTDLINRPEKVIIGRKISKRWALMTHTIGNVAGFIISVYLAIRCKMYILPLIQIGCCTLLWFYSTHFKKQYVVGNLAVALLTALTIVTLALYEPTLYIYLPYQSFLSYNNYQIVHPLIILVVYAFFAFMLTWMREIVKDIEDYKGDKEDGCTTMPILMGINRSVRYILYLGIFTLIPLLLFTIFLIGTKWISLGIYIFIALIIPLLIFLLYLPQKQSTRHFTLCSKFLKLIMILGLLTIPVYHWMA